MGFVAGVWSDGLEVRLGDDADTTALHLLEVVEAFHIAKEEHDLQRLNVRSGRNHIDRHDDPRIVAIAELLQTLFRPISAVGDLLREIVSAAELFAKNLKDVIRVTVVLGENQRFWNLRPAGEHLSEELVAKGLNH